MSFSDCLMGRRSLQHRKSNGSVVLELIVCLPILVIGIMSIVELGLLSANQAVVQGASVVGADMAVSLACDLPTGGAVPNEIVDAVNIALSCQGSEATCIRVEHSLGPSPPYVLMYGSGVASPAAPPPSTSDYVCVSVCVENSDLAPNLLQTFCFNLDETYSQHTTCRCASCD